MCGRFVQSSSRERLQRVFQIDRIPADLQPSYNLAPTQQLLAVAAREGERRATLLKWGLVPSWADDPSIGNRMINARSESVNEKPAFRNAFKKRRCLIPADGFYEWFKRDDEKLPFYFFMEDHEPFAFAGLWEHNEKTGQPLTTCTVLTTEANNVMAPIHDRMPVILSPEDYDSWLNPESEPEELLPLLRPYEGNNLSLYPVSKQVNSPRTNGPELIEPLEGNPAHTLFDDVSEKTTRNSK